MKRLWSQMVHWVAQTGIHPNAITAVGTLCQCFAGWLLYSGHSLIAGWFLVFVAPLDALDGAVAKASGQVTRFGAFLDSTLDRISDMVLFGGLALFYSRTGHPWQAIASFYCLMASVSISYSKARAENLIPDCKVGIAQRPERLILLIAACVLGSIPAGLVLIAVLATLTVAQRIRHTWLQIQGLRLSKMENYLFLDFRRDSLSYKILALICLAILLAAKWLG
jgi:CDP-diacylglycerol--glycerol-3-phosphate 3-phosphatidyltransferase